MIPLKKIYKKSNESAESNDVNEHDDLLEAGNTSKYQSDPISKSNRKRTINSIQINFASGKISQVTAYASRMKQHGSVLSTSTPAVKLLLLLLLPTLTCAQRQPSGFGSPPRAPTPNPRRGPSSAWVFRTTIRNPPKSPSPPGIPHFPLNPSPYIPNPTGHSLTAPNIPLWTHTNPAAGQTPPNPSKADMLTCCTEMQRLRDSMALLERHVAEVANLVRNFKCNNGSAAWQSQLNNTGLTGNNGGATTHNTHNNNGWTTTGYYHNNHESTRPYHNYESTWSYNNHNSNNNERSTHKPPKNNGWGTETTPYEYEWTYPSSEGYDYNNGGATDDYSNNRGTTDNYNYNHNSNNNGKSTHKPSRNTTPYNEWTYPTSEDYNGWGTDNPYFNNKASEDYEFNGGSTSRYNDVFLRYT